MRISKFIIAVVVIATAISAIDFLHSRNKLYVEKELLIARFEIFGNE